MAAPAEDGQYRMLWVIAIWLACVFFLGGSSRVEVPSLLILRPLSVLFLAYALSRLTAAHLRQHRFLLGMAAAWLGLHLLQLMPLPPAVWHALPGRGIIREVDAQAGLGEIWRPLSIAPLATMNAVWALMAPIATLVIAVQFGERSQVRLLAAVLALGFISAGIGLLQMLGDPHGPLFFYRFTHSGLPVGLFANRNHQAMLLAAMLPMLAVWAATTDRFDRVPRQYRAWAPRLALLLGALILVPMTLITGSRAGVVLVGAALLSLPLLGLDQTPAGAERGRAEGKRPRRDRSGQLLIGGLAIIFVVTVVLGRALSFDRIVALDAQQDMRLRALPTILSLIATYAPWGSGLGTFDEAFRQQEGDALLSPYYFNHAHDDWLELVLTGGIPAAALLAIALLGLARTLPRLAMPRHGEGRRAVVMARLGIVLLVIIAIASISDYPLRVPSLGCLAAIAVFWLDQARLRYFTPPAYQNAGPQHQS